MKNTIRLVPAFRCGTGTRVRGTVRYHAHSSASAGTNLRDLVAVRYGTSKKLTSIAAFFLYDSEQLHILISIKTAFFVTIHVYFLI